MNIIINPRRACAARVTVVVRVYVCTCMCVCVRGGSRGAWGAVAPLSKWSMTSCAYNCQPLLCFSGADLGGALGAEAPPLLGYHLKNDVESGRST